MSFIPIGISPRPHQKNNLVKSYCKQTDVRASNPHWKMQLMLAYAPKC